MASLAKVEFRFHQNISLPIALCGKMPSSFGKLLSLYKSVLEEKVKKHMLIIGTAIFQQNSVPCHTAR